MEEFFYEARDSVSGNLVKGCFKAESEEEVVSYLKRERYLIIRINHRDFASLKQNMLRRLQTGKIKRKHLIMLCRQLSIMLEAGINIIDAVSVLEQNCTNKYMKKFLVQTTVKLKEGNSLAVIWGQKENVVPSYLLNSLNAAESTGMLSGALSQSADFLEKIYDEQQKIRQICIYPACLMILLFVIANIMILFVLPAFADIFQRMKLPLPFITRCVFSAGLFIKDNYFLIFTGFLLVVPVFIGCWQKDTIKYKFYEYVFKIPLAGKFMQDLFLLQINRQMEFLIGSGIDIDESLSIIIAGFNNKYMNKMLKTVQYNLRQGFSLYASFKNTGLKNNIFMELINVGEQTGMLKETLRYNDVFLSRNINNLIAEFTKILEPALMIIAGTVIGLFIAAVVLPLFELGGSIGL